MFKNYWAPTPVIFRKLGDSLLAVGAMAQTYAIISENQKWMLYVAIGCMVGKFLTNFFADISLNDKANEKP